MMLAFAATSRFSEISYLSNNFMAKTERKYIFSFNPTLSFQEFEQDISSVLFLC